MAQEQCNGEESEREVVIIEEDSEQENFDGENRSHRRIFLEIKSQSPEKKQGNGKKCDIPTIQSKDYVSMHQLYIKHAVLRNEKKT